MSEETDRENRVIDRGVGVLDSNDDRFELMGVSQTVVDDLNDAIWEMAEKHNVFGAGITIQLAKANRPQFFGPTTFPKRCPALVRHIVSVINSSSDMDT